MRSGIKIKDIVLGTGDEATHGKTVAVSTRLFLNRGTELTAALTRGPTIVIDFARRDCIAGLRYGIEGMRVGGQRELIISPHLAYGADGVPGHVPPNAVIRGQVELLEVRDRGVRKPEDYPPGKHLYVFHPGEATRNQPRWQFGVEEDGRCGITITRPVSGTPWRHARYSFHEANLDSETTRSLFRSALELPVAFPTDCFRHDELWADMTERGNAITRNRVNNTLCLTIGVMERGQWLRYFSMAETSQGMRESPLMKVITGLIENEESGRSKRDRSQ